MGLLALCEYDLTTNSLCFLENKTKPKCTVGGTSIVGLDRLCMHTTLSPPKPRRQWDLTTFAYTCDLTTSFLCFLENQTKPNQTQLCSMHWCSYNWKNFFAVLPEKQKQTQMFQLGLREGTLVAPGRPVRGILGNLQFPWGTRLIPWGTRLIIEIVTYVVSVWNCSMSTWQ